MMAQQQQDMALPFIVREVEEGIIEVDHIEVELRLLQEGEGEVVTTKLKHTSLQDISQTMYGRPHRLRQRLQQQPGRASP